MSAIFDISLSIGPDLVVWPGNPAPSLRPVMRCAAGQSSNVSELRLGTHTGTHVDPPSHFIDGGAGADELSLETLIGAASVLDLRAVSRSIGPEDLARAGLANGATRVLLKTTNSERWRERGRAFSEDFVSLSPEGAQWLVARGVRLVGVDFLSVEAFGAPGHPTHHTLLGAGVVILEGLDLSAVPSGEFTLVCLPLKLEGGDGSPARAVLLRD